jgi:hypothetical protein
MKHLRRTPTLAVLAGLGLLPLACAEPANPVMGPSTNPGGKIAGANSDAAVGEAGARTEDVYVPPDAQLTTCNLLRQDCPKHPLTMGPQGCYRISGGAHCAPAGQLPHGSNTCESDLDCTPGLVCARSYDTGGDCQNICDPGDGSNSVCPDNYYCLPMAPSGVLSKAGYCSPPLS